MARRLPPLNALRAFEAAGRHLSFTKAAEELNVTAAAVSHQVKALEDYLGVQLFRRLTRGLLLTDAGQTCLPGLKESFDGLAAAVERLRGLEERGALTISVAQSFSAKWLVPRLDRFHKAYPDIDVRIFSTSRLVDFARDDVDLAIRYGLGRWPGLRIDLLRTEEIFPVCSPALLEGPHPLKVPEDLRWHTLLHDALFKTVFGDDAQDWRTWLQAAGVSDIDPTRGPSLSPLSMVIQAAIDGQGVALGRSVLVEADLADGRLVKPFELTIPVDYAYYVVSPETAAGRPKVAAFREWIMEEAGRQQAPTLPAVQ
ncbi:MAG: transcriptional regulator GcvA [Kiloniellaceae bacterium]